MRQGRRGRKGVFFALLSLWWWTGICPLSEALAQEGGEWLRLREVRLTDEDGQKTLLLRLSQPPGEVEYFPLRSPARLVIDVRGPVEVLPRVETYPAADPLISRVRVGYHAGKMRLVLDLKAEKIPSFSVDSTGGLIKALLGEKGNGKGEMDSQVLFLAEEEKRAPPYLARSRTPPISPTPVETAKPVLSQASPEPSRRVEGEEPPAIETARPVLSPAEGPVVSQVERDESSEDVPLPSPAPPEKPSLAPAVQLAQGSPEEQETPAPVVSPVERPTPPAIGAVGEEFQPPPEASRYTGQPISLDFRDTDIRDVLRVLADISGMNIVATDDVTGRITLRLINVPWDQALDVVLQANGLEKLQVGNVIQVSTAERLSRERTARLEAQRAEENLELLRTEYIRVNYAKAQDLATLIQGAGGAPGGPPAPGAPAARAGRAGAGILTDRGSVSADAASNTLIVRDVQTGIDAAREFVRQLDIQTSQVLIEAYLVEAARDVARDLGIQWGYRHIASPETGNPTGVDFPGRIGFGGGLETGGLVPEGPAGSGQSTAIPFIADFPALVQPGAGSALNLALGSLSGSRALNARLTALEAQGRVRIISRPRVTTLNNREARIESVRIVRVPTPSTTSVVAAPGALPTAQAAFQEFSTGIILTVMPQVSADGFVFLIINAKSSQLGASSIDSTITNIPDEISREANSNVLIKDGETFVLGGIFRGRFETSEAGVPYLRSIPVLGWLFKGRFFEDSKEELLVFITPRIVAGTQLAGLPTAQQLWENRPRSAGSQPQGGS